MKEIELYDIITLENDDEYVVINIINNNNSKYLLLSWIDENEEPDLEKLKIVKEISDDSEKNLEIIDNQELLKTLSKQFLETLGDTFN